MSARYARSEAMLDEALKVIPLGTQTFSKSYTQYPKGVSPYFAKRAKGSRLWDVDGNEYTDFVNALCSVTLGYNDPDVTNAVREQIEDGVIFTLTHPLEAEVARKIIEIVPSAEMVRFGKNGSDATAGAVRIARAFTGRDKVLVAGYHGWQDWYIGSTARNLGVPQATRALTRTFPYNDLASLDTALAEWSDEVAAIVLEPMNVAAPLPGFLEGVRERATKHGAVLVFDEVITGFRFANGGAQEYFGVTPDLTTLGKGVANGYPVSVVCGRADIMKLMEEVFFSFTMGGETLSLAAALATLTKLQREPVIATMRARGEHLAAGVRERIEKHGVSRFISFSGHPAWTFLTFSDADGIGSFAIKTLWMQELMERGFLSLGTHNISYAHTEEDVDRLLVAYDEIFPLLRTAVESRAMQQYLKCEPLVPLFKVR